MNKQIWEMYKNSDRGKKIIDLFSLFDGDINILGKKIKDIALKYIPGIKEDLFISTIELIFDCVTAENITPQANETSKEYFTNLIENLELTFIDEDKDGKLIKSTNSKDIIVKKADYRKLCSLMRELSLFLYIQFDDFYPILNNEDFGLFAKNCDVLGIDIPNVPNSKDKKERLMYYVDLCEKIKTFETENGLSSQECCACLYDFSSMLQNSDKEKTEIPEPTNIWFTGASNSDYKTILQHLTPETISVWACNEATKRGDIIVLYCLAPQSYIHSIWRANSDGVANPFNYYYGRTTVTNPIKINPITFDDLKADKYWSNVPIVRKNLQGINGVEISAQDYDELMRMLNEKGFDISTLPKLYTPNVNIEKNICIEKDVEEKILIPILKELGYSSNDWTRQLSQKAGRGLKAIPDFVFFPKGEKHFQNAAFILEAKLYMHSAQERMNAYNQALSYSKMMSSKIMGLCDKERLIIYKKNNDGFFDRFNPLFEKHWENLKEPETFAKLKKIIGRDIVSKM